MRRLEAKMLQPEEIRKEAVRLFEKYYKGIELSEVVVSPSFDHDDMPIVYVRMVYDAELDEFLEASRGALTKMPTDLRSKLGEDPDRYPGFPMVSFVTKAEHESRAHDSE